MITANPLLRTEQSTDKIGDGLVPMIGGVQSQLSLKFGKSIHNSGYKDLP